MIRSLKIRSPKPEVKLGKTDGFRYVAFKPPLSDEEKGIVTEHAAEYMSRFKRAMPIYVIDVPGPVDQACSMVQFPTEFTGAGNPEELQRIAGGIADSLKPARQAVVRPNVVQMGWGNSSPFNPVPEQSTN